MSLQYYLPIFRHFSLKGAQ